MMVIYLVQSEPVFNNSDNGVNIQWISTQLSGPILYDSVIVLSLNLPDDGYL